MDQQNQTLQNLNLQTGKTALNPKNIRTMKKDLSQGSSFSSYSTPVLDPTINQTNKTAPLQAVAPTANFVSPKNVSSSSPPVKNTTNLPINSPAKTIKTSALETDDLPPLPPSVEEKKDTPTSKNILVKTKSSKEPSDKSDDIPLKEVAKEPAKEIVKEDPKPILKTDNKYTKEQLQKMLANLVDERRVLQEKRSSIHKDLELQTIEINTEITNQKKIIEQLEDKKEEINSSILSDAMAREGKIEEETKELRLANSKTTDPKEIARIEASLQAKEAQRQTAEKIRWEAEDKIMQIIEKIQKAKDKLNSLLSEKETVESKKRQMSLKEATIGLEEQKLRLQIDSAQTAEKQKKLAQEYADLLPKKNTLAKSIQDLLSQKSSIEQEIITIEKKEDQTSGLEKREIEKERRQMEQKRQSISQDYLAQIKVKETIDKQMSAMTKEAQSLDEQNTNLLSQISALEKQIKDKETKI